VKFKASVIISEFFFENNKKILNRWYFAVLTVYNRKIVKKIVHELATMLSYGVTERRLLNPLLYSRGQLSF